MALPKLGEKKNLFWQLWQCHCWKCKNNNNNNNNCFGNCGNGIAENVKKKKNVLAIVAMALPKMGKKKLLWNLWKSKKKSCHVHNIFTINHMWLIIISSKKFVTS